MLNYFKSISIFFFFIFIYGCDSNEKENQLLSSDISWHRNSDEVFYGKTCVDDKLFIVSSTPHSRLALAGIIGSCTGDEVFHQEDIKDREKEPIWKKSKSGVRYFYTCIENHLFTVSPGSYFTSILAFAGNDCSIINN